MKTYEEIAAQCVVGGAWSHGIEFVIAGHYVTTFDGKWMVARIVEPKEYDTSRTPWTLRDADDNSDPMRGLRSTVVAVFDTREEAYRMHQHVINKARGF